MHKAQTGLFVILNLIVAFFEIKKRNNETNSRRKEDTR